MKRLYLTLGGTVAVSAVTAVGVIALTAPSSIVQEVDPPVPIEVSLGAVEDVSEQVEEVVEPSATEEPVPTVETSTPAPAPASDPLRPTDRPVVHVPGDVLDPANEGRITTVAEYRLTYAGVCPSEQPENVFKAHNAESAALGLNAGGLTALGSVEQAWQSYMINDPNITGYVISPRTLQMAEDHWDNDIAFYMDWEGERVYWDAVWQQNRPYDPNLPKKDWWDTMANQMTAYLRDLNRRYKALCPNG